jgi:hypothetical protein
MAQVSIFAMAFLFLLAVVFQIIALKVFTAEGNFNDFKTTHKQYVKEKYCCIDGDEINPVGHITGCDSPHDATPIYGWYVAIAWVIFSALAFIGVMALHIPAFRWARQ